MTSYRLCAAIVLLAATPAAHAVGSLVLPAPDVAQVLATDPAEGKARPWRFAIPIPVLVTPTSAGLWTQLPDGRARWRLIVTAAGAKHLNFGFSRFTLPAGAEMTIAAVDGSDRRGPFRAADGTAGQLWTPVVRGDGAVLELTLPIGARPGPVLTLSTVNYGFRGFGAKDDLAKSGDCNIDVACAEGDAWRDEIRSVARYTISGSLLCTGTLLNNTAQDFTPYFLTAAHCVTSHAQAPSVVVYWNYETSTCGGRPDGQLTQTQSGATLVATSGKSDFSLLLLAARPDPAFGVYYAGWDNRDQTWTDVTGIHHPSGDEKRIARFFGATVITGTALNVYSAPGDLEYEAGTAANPAFLMVEDWDRGVTEGGSSGSGLWNAEHRIVGQLSGGGAACSGITDNGSPDWYGRFHRNWFDAPSPVTSVATHLDPEGSNAEFLDGADPNASAGGNAGSAVGISGGGGGVPAAVIALLLGVAVLGRVRQAAK